MIKLSPSILAADFAELGRSCEAVMAAGADMLPVRIIYGTKDGRLHLFCKVRIVFGEPIPAADLQIRDQSHKMAELRRMKNRLRDELEQLLADNAFAVRLAETAAEEPAAPDDKPQLPE